MSRTYQTNDYDVEDEDTVRDGESVRVPMLLMDGTQREVHQHFNDHVQNELDALASMASHRPGCLQDGPSSRQAVKDSSYGLFERRGTWLQEATAARDAAYAATESRQQWRSSPWTPTNAPDNQNTNLSSQGNAMNRYKWSAEELAVLKKAQEILGITFPTQSYAPLSSDLHGRLVGLGPVGSENPDDPGSMSRTGDSAAVAARDAAFDALCKRSENAWRKAGAQ